MSTLKGKLINTLIRIPLDGGVNPIFGLCCGIIGLFQLIAALTDPDSSVNIATNWSDPNVYISTPFMVIFGAVSTLIYSVLVVIKFATIDGQENIVKDETKLCLFSTLLAYMRVICETIVLGPFVIGCLKILTQDSQNKGLVAISIVGLTLYFTIVYPIALFCTSDTTCLTGNGDRKYSILNVELFINVYKLLFVINAVMSNTANKILTPIFFVLYCLIIYYRPFYCYADQAFKRGTLSIVAFICASRAFNLLFENVYGSALVQLLGAVSFAYLIEYLATSRLQEIIEQDKLTIYKAKILIFMAQNSQAYLQTLEKFLFSIHSKCPDTDDSCKQLLSALTSKNGSASEQLWFRFIVSYIQSEFNLKGTDKLSRTELKKRTSEYSQIIFDLAQIYLFKLNQKNSAFILVSFYKSHLEIQALDQLWDTRRARTFNYYFNTLISDRKQLQKSLNYSPQKYLDFQSDYSKYLKSVFKATNIVSSFWRQLIKNNANQTKIVESINEFEEGNKEVKCSYQQIVQHFKQSKDIVDPITWDYLDLVLNVGENQPIFMVQCSSEEIAVKKKMKGAKIQEKAKLYTIDPETPTCLISANPRYFGRIQFSNNFFDEIIDRQCGRVEFIDELIIPELAPWHRQKMQQFVHKDVMSSYHNNSFIINGNRKLIYVEVIVQLIPSVAQGLRYSLFIKKFQPDRQLFISKKQSFQLLYNSQSFEKILDDKVSYQLLVDSFNQQIFSQIKEKKKLQMKLGGDQYSVNILKQIQGKDLLILQLRSPQQEQAQNISKSLIQSRIQKQQQVEEQNNENKQNKKSSSIIQNQQQNIEDESVTKKQETIKNILYDLIIQKQKKEKGFITNVKKISVIATIAIAIGLAAIIMIKNNILVYQNIYHHNQDFFSLGHLVIDTTDKLQVINIYPTSTESQTAYTALSTTTPAITSSFNTFRSFYDLKYTEVPWGTLTFLANGTYLPGSQLSNIALNNYLQTPLNNLTQYPKADYSFATTYQLLTPPLSQIQLDFYTFVINSLYFALPGLQTLKKNLNQNQLGYIIGYAQFKVSIPVISILIITIILFIILLVYSLKIKQLRNNTYKMIDTIQPQLVQSRLQAIQKFTKKYNSLVPDYDKTIKKVSMFQSNFTMSRNASKLQKPESKNNSKVIQDNTQLQLNSRFKHQSSPTGLNLRNYSSDVRENVYIQGRGDQIKQGKKSIRETIFTEENCFSRSTIILIGLLPIVLFISAFAISEYQQQKKLTKILNIQQNINQLQLLNNQVRLYLLHYGVYDQQLSSYKSISSTISQKLSLMSTKISLLPQYQDNPAKYLYTDNICSNIQNGIYNGVSFTFNNLNNVNYCSSYDGGILTQGFKSTIQRYLQTATLLYNNNRQAANFNSTQRQAYLNDAFFTTTSGLINYLNLHLKWVNSQVYDTVKSKQSLYKTVWMIICGLMIGVIALSLILSGKRYLNQQEKDITFTQNSYMLVSYRSISTNQKLRTFFLQNQSYVKILK